MNTLPRTERFPIAAPVYDRCPAGCDLADAARCWLGHERAIRADLMVARESNSPDAEVLASDLRAAEKRVDCLLASAFGRAA